MRIAVTLSIAAALMLNVHAASDTISDGIAAFKTVQKVLQDPRCQNCHIPGDSPLQFDEGRTHAMNVQRGPDGKGAAALPCATCHGSANPPASYGEDVPPGAPDLAFAPPGREKGFYN